MGECIYCHGDGMDPTCDYLLPCPYCGGTGGELLRSTAMTELKTEYQAVMWAEMAPDIYSGENCDQHRARWHAYADGDMDSDYLETIDLSAATFPPGTRITVEVPCCPDCGVSADYERRADGKCECGFDWPAWVEDQYS